jgi:hypothetical protein
VGYANVCYSEAVRRSKHDHLAQAALFRDMALSFALVGSYEMAGKVQRKVVELYRYAHAPALCLSPLRHRVEVRYAAVCILETHISYLRTRRNSTGSLNVNLPTLP